MVAEYGTARRRKREMLKCNDAVTKTEAKWSKKKK